MTDWLALVLPTTTPPKSSDVTDSVAAGAGAMPWPVRLISCGLVAVLSQT